MFTSFVFTIPFVSKAIIILTGAFIIFIKLLPSNPVIIKMVKTGYIE